MTEMVDRVARAIHAELEKTWCVMLTGHGEELGRAAIAAMREPTEAMMRAGDAAAESACSGDEGLEAWDAMIDAALENGQ